jgi:hypothetical protein
MSAIPIGSPRERATPAAIANGTSDQMIATMTKSAKLGIEPGPLLLVVGNGTTSPFE